MESRAWIACPPDAVHAPSRQRKAVVRRISKTRAREAAAGYVFVAPAVILFLILGVYTLGYGLRLSFVEWNGIRPDWTPVGLKNYQRLLYGDPDLSATVWHAFARTGWVTAAMAVGVVVISLPIALALNAAPRLRSFLRTVYFLPYVTAGIAVFYAWRFILLPDGGLNRVLHVVGLDTWVRSEGFLGDPTTSLWATTAVLIWATVPLGILLYLAGVQSIDKSVLEAAQVDGAGSLRMVREIYWPLLRPTTALLVALSLRTSLHEFQVFLLMTNGGPLDRSTTASLLSFQFAFQPNSQYGLASALGWILFLLGVVISVGSFALLKRRD